MSGQLLVVGLSPSGLVVGGVSGQLLVVELSPSGLVVGLSPSGLKQWEKQCAGSLKTNPGSQAT